MATSETFFKRLTRLFRSGPAIQRRIKGNDTRSYYNAQLVQGNYGYRAGTPFGFGRENSPFSVLGSYGLLDRMARYGEFAEMEYMPEIAAALDIYADETVGGDDRGKAFHIYSDNTKIKAALEDLFYDILNVEFNLKMWTRNICKYGDFFLYTEVHPDVGVVNVTPIAVNEVEREEGFDLEDPYAVRFKWLTRGNKYLENWQVAHFRILGNDLFLPYGTCLDRNTRILTDDGVRLISEIRPGDRVSAFDRSQQKKIFTKVLNVICSGEKEVYRISTRHNFVEASREHKIMCYNPISETFDYKHVLECHPGELLVIDREHSLEKRIEIDRVRPLKARNGFWDNISLVPRYVDRDFARLMGFLLGDGWIHNNSVCFALGVDQGQNNFYIKLLEKFTGKVPKIQNSHYSGKPASVACHSKMLVTILQRMGFRGSVYTKRFPAWIFSATKEIKENFIRGLHEADGSVHVDRWGCSRFSIELANEEMIRDTKTLLQTLGYKTGKICSRSPRQNIFIENRKIKEAKSSYYFYYFKSKIKQSKKHDANNRISDDFILEPIISIEKLGKRETWDIHVQDKNHNFYANNIVVHNSVLESSRRLWRQLQMLEDAMLVYRVVRSPERRVFFIDVGNVAPNDVPNYMDAAKATLRSRSSMERETGREDQRFNATSMLDDYFIPVRGNQQGTRVETLSGGAHVTATEDIEYIQRKLFAALKVPKPYLNFDENLCLSGETRIPLLGGETLQIKDLADDERNRRLIKEGRLWVYSTTLDGKVVPGKIKDCWKTKETDQTIKITLDNEKVIECTPNHPFLLRTGTYVRADELKAGDSLMPVYHKISNKHTGGDKLHGYEMVFDNLSQKWIYTHKMVADGLDIQKDEKSLAEEKIHVIHHKDFKKRNNNPDNFILMGRGAHGKLHGDLAKKYLQSTESIQKLNALRETKEFWDSHQAGIERAWNDPILSKKRKTAIAQANVKYNKIAIMHKKLAKMRKNGFMTGASAPNYKSRPALEDIKTALTNRCFGITKTARVLNCSACGIKETIKSETSHETYKSFAKEYCNKNGISYKRWNIPVNFGEWADVATRGKNRAEFYINANISRETFLRACKKNNIDPMKWFETNLNKKNHKVVSVEAISLDTAIPVYDLTVETYHNFLLDAGVIVHNSAKASLAQMDVRFSRTIQGLQKILISELNKVAMIHLFSMGFDGEDLVDFELKLSNPSSVALQQKLELWQVKFDIGGTAKETKLVDERWVQKNILELTDDEIDFIEKGLLRDKGREMQIEAMELQDPDPLQPSKTTDAFNPTAYDVKGQNVPKTPAVEQDQENSKIARTFGVELTKEDDDEEDESPFKRPEETGTGPIKASPFLTRNQKNRSRRLGVGRGRQNTAMPDMKAMLSPKNKYNKDIYGQRTEGYDPVERDPKEDYAIQFEPQIGKGMKSIMKRLKVRLDETRTARTLLQEQIEPEKVIDIEIDADETDLILENIENQGPDTTDDSLESIEETSLSEVFNKDS